MSSYYCLLSSLHVKRLRVKLCVNDKLMRSKCPYPYVDPESDDIVGIKKYKDFSDTMDICF